MTIAATRFRLERPPVRSVTLTIRFEASPRLQGWHLEGFFRKVSSHYLAREEVAPRPAVEAAGYEFIPPEDAWPIPRTECIGEDRSLSVQGDELEVVWNFGDRDEGREYPGFDSLMKGMEDHLYDLISSVSDHDVTIAPREVECFYENAIEEITASELAVGVLTGWADTSSKSVPQQGYVGVRLASVGKPRGQSCSSLVMVDSGDDQPPRLAIRVGRLLESGERAEDAMRQAHDELISLFRTHTSEQLRSGWGEL